MTHDEIKTKVDLEDIDIYPSPNGHMHTVHMAREYNGIRYSTSRVLNLTPTDEEINAVREMMVVWWAEIVRDNRVPE